MTNKLFLVFLIAFIGLSYSTIYQVGPTRDLKLPTEVDWANINAGDIIEIDWREEPYRSKWIISRLGTEENPIIIRGLLGPNGEKPIIDAANATSRSGMSFPNQQRSLLRIGGASSGPNYADHLIVENLEFRNAAPGSYFYTHGGVYTEYATNAAAIWIERGQNIIIRNCEITGSVFGINTNGGYENHTIEYNYIYGNGFVGTSNPNIHTDSRHTVIQFNRFGPLTLSAASNIRDRSAGTIIRYNWIVGGNRQLELNHNPDYSTHPEFGKTFIYGNVIIEPFGVTDNKQMIFYGGTNADHRIYCYYNNILSYRNDGNNIIASSAPGFNAYLYNNIIHNPRNGNIAIAEFSPNVLLEGNYLPSSFVESYGTANITFMDNNIISSESPGFIDGLNFNYELNESSICRDASVSLPNIIYEKNLLPDRQYVTHMQSTNRYSINDIGAFSYEEIVVTTGSGSESTTGGSTTGSPITPYQECPSGYVSSAQNCVYAAGSCNFDVVPLNASINSPFLYPSPIVQLDTLRLIVIQKITSGRAMKRISLISNNSECNYPGPYWSKTVNSLTCHDEYVSNLPTQFALSNCGFVRDQFNPSYIYYDGKASTTWEDELTIDPSRGLNITRSSTTMLTFRVGFPRTVTVSTSNLIIGSPTILSALIEQSYDSDTGILNIKLFTSVQSPYRLNSLINSETPFGVIWHSSAISFCSGNSVNYCDQILSISFARNGSSCYFDGGYRMHVMLCDDFCSSSENTTIYFGVQSGNVCGRLDDLTSITPSLSSWGGYNGTFETPQNSFVIGSRIYLRLSLTSNGPRIQNSSVSSVVVTNAVGAPITIYQNESSIAIGFITELSSIAPTQQVHVISFIYGGAWFGSISSNTISTVFVTTDLVYDNGNKRSVVVRSDSPNYENQLSTSTSVELIRDGADKDMLSISSTVSVASLLILLINIAILSI